MKPPMELPAMTTGRPTTSSTKSRRKSRQSSWEYANACFSDLPYPGKVGAYTCVPDLSGAVWLKTQHMAVMYV